MLGARAETAGRRVSASITRVQDPELHELFARLAALLDVDPAEAVRQARQIDLASPDRLNAMMVRAAILVDGGAAARQQDATEEGLALFRELYALHPTAAVAYNLANAIVAVVGAPSRGADWLGHQERTREQRAEARRLYWDVARDHAAPRQTRTQAWTNLANQFTNSYRLYEAHDARLAALAIDPENGVAAGTAARDLLWLVDLGGCSDLTRIEAVMLAQRAARHLDRVRAYAGVRVAEQVAALAEELGEETARSPHEDPFVRWVERERLTLAPAVELVDPSLGKLDWLMLPGIMERGGAAAEARPPPVFAMFNVLKADFILARDLAWRATSETGERGWPETGRFADTLDYAVYGPEVSALILAHRTALDLLDKVAVAANHYFAIGQAPEKVFFGKLWRQTGGKKTGSPPLALVVENAIRAGAPALYGLTELADDYVSEAGILRPQKNLRNAGTHRFVALHDLGDPADSRPALEVEHHPREKFADETLGALRVARSAVQMLALAITQHERRLVEGADGPVGTLLVPDHDWVRGQRRGADKA